MRRHTTASLALTALAATATACTSGAASPGTTPPTTDTPPVVETLTPDTRPPRHTDDSGRPNVTFDPCHDIPYEVMIDAGYDVKNREVVDKPMGWYTFLGCLYRDTNEIPGVRLGYGLHIMAGNVTFDEMLDQVEHRATPITVNGRPALLDVGALGNENCELTVQTTFGIVIFNRVLHSTYMGPAPESAWCAGLEELVTTVEPYIPG